MNVKRQRVGCINSLSLYCGPLRFKYCSSKRKVTNFSARQTKYLFARNVSSFMNMVIWPLSEIIAFPIAWHELLKGILVQRENEQMTNCPQLQYSQRIGSVNYKMPASAHISNFNAVANMFFVSNREISIFASTCFFSMNHLYM
ncbi:hypothetical protein T03_3072 [Trichinella britovi]|uniref:Uncharacterized protein n=1 Tax=Trichinella britovi TaxID=45882 RepID=A0A0V1C4X0_TRIBR|nr:hypothetical protein T03_3072 [Trichinella britovi]